MDKGVFFHGSIHQNDCLDTLNSVLQILSLIFLVRNVCDCFVLKSDIQIGIRSFREKIISSKVCLEFESAGLTTLLKLFRRKSERFWHSLKKNCKLNTCLLQKRNFFSIQSYCHVELNFEKNGRQFSPEIRKLVVHCPKKCKKIRFFQKKFSTGKFTLYS